jgi:Kef-type K+ transport system membrane component KefB
MRKVGLFSALLIIGLVGSQVLPAGAAELRHWLMLATMVALSFIMIHVGYEFELNKRDVRKLGWDYVVAFTAAAFPWVFCAAYFVFVMAPRSMWGEGDLWKEMLLQGRFASPTSAGVLFSMLAAAGLGATWVFHKARVLAILDDLDTILLMIPLQIMMVGMRPQLAVIVVLSVGLLWAAWKFLHQFRIPISWPWVLAYSMLITGASEAAYQFSKAYDPSMPVHVEVLLPAFVLGCLMARPPGASPHSNDPQEGALEGPESPREQRVSTIVSGIFMVLVGLSMPSLLGHIGTAAGSPTSPTAGMTLLRYEGVDPQVLEDKRAFPGWGWIAVHVLAITLVSNLGKMFPAMCYRREATLRERLAVAIGMWPRGEVGAGVLVISIGYGIGGPALTVAVLSLSLNLLMTGVFILIVRRLVAPTAPAPGIPPGREAAARGAGRAHETAPVHSRGRS